MSLKVTCKAAGDGAISAREGHCAAAIGSRLYVFGGILKDEDIVREKNDLWFFDSGKNSVSLWKIKCCVHEVLNSKILIFRNEQVEESRMRRNATSSCARRCVTRSCGFKTIFVRRVEPGGRLAAGTLRFWLRSYKLTGNLSFWTARLNLRYCLIF